MTTILVVDDSQFLRDRIARLLSTQGYQTLTAGNGEEAITLYREHTPDAVLMDITMPHKDGLQALEEIHTADSEAKIIMLTALNQEVLASRAIQMGAKDFLAKPISSSLLFLTLERVLKKTT